MSSSSIAHSAGEALEPRVRGGAGPVDNSEDGETRRARTCASVCVGARHELSALCGADLVLWRVAQLGDGDVSACRRLDFALSRRVEHGGRLLFGVQNLFHDGEREFGADLFGATNESVAAVFVRLETRF